MLHGEKQDNLISILKAGIDSVRPSLLFPRIFRHPDYDLQSWLGSKERYLLCLGKAALASAECILSLIPCKGQFVLTPYSAESAIPNVHFGSHPIPDQKSYDSTIRLIEWIETLPQEAHLLTILSGGTSALLVSPRNRVSLESKAQVNSLLIRSGASIQEINIVRKHLSEVKGGQLAQKIGYRKCLVLVISDVIGDDLATIGSGPFYPDPTTFAEAIDVLHRYGIWKQTAKDVQETMKLGVDGLIPETPKPGSLSCTHRIVASNQSAIAAAAEKAAALGYAVHMESRPICGDVHDAADLILDRILRSGPNSACILGGEITIRIQGSGTGGRNQHLALLLTERLPGMQTVFGAAGTDGMDGNSTAAGAWTDGTTLERASGLATLQRAIDNCDSFHYFEAIHQNIFTGPTGTNVMDLYVALV